MKVAIIGAGGAGMMTAHLLDGEHDVTVFEREPVLGGNIRTLGRNVSCAALPEGTILDAGVLEFGVQGSPTFLAFLDDLGIKTRDVPISTSITFASGARLEAPLVIARTPRPPWQSLARRLALVPIAAERAAFRRRTARVSREQLASEPLSRYLRPSRCSSWIASLLMYAYSLEWPEARKVPAELAVDVLSLYLRPGIEWVAVPGGVYRYIEAILDRFRGDVRTNTTIESVRRRAAGVEIGLCGGAVHSFDKVVFATTPDQVLRLLADPSDGERARFGAWQPNHATVQIHEDTSLYERRGIGYFSEFDLFETEGGRYGYNAYLNRIAGLATGAGPHYSLAFGLEREVTPERVLHVQQHTMARFRPEGWKQRRAIMETNGERDTYHAGAYLGDGLHEGAAASALQVSRLLGGRGLTRR